MSGIRQFSCQRIDSSIARRLLNCRHRAWLSVPVDLTTGRGKDRPGKAEGALVNDVVRIAVEVTAEDIAQGVRQSGRDCPIARAVQRTLFCEGVTVGYGAIWFPGGRMVLTPAEV